MLVPAELNVDWMEPLAEAEDRLRHAVVMRAQVVRNTPLFRFRPNPVQWEFIRHEKNKLLAIMGANKVGKSTIVSVEGISRALGFRPYLPQDDPHFFVHQPNGERIRIPNKGQVAAEDFPNGIRKIQWPMWHAWLPKNQYRIANTERGTPRELWIDVSALPWADRSDPLYPWSRVYFYAYAQGRESFTGFDPDWILNDEPPPKDVWIEQMRGLVSTGGGWMGAMTLVEIHQAWIFDVFSPREKMPWEGVDDEVDRLSEGLTSHVVNGKTRDNLRRPDGSGALTEKDVQDFEAMLTPEERAVRIEGQRIHMVGTEWGRYWDESIHVVPHRAPDPSNPQIMAVDPHPTKPYGILWAEVNEDDEIYVWAECYDWRLDTLEAIADHIKVIEEWKPIEAHRRPGEEKKPPVGYRENTSGLQPVIRLIDPFSKVRERGAGASAAEQLGQLGLHFVPWKRANKSVRVRNVRQFLQKGWGPEGRPRLTISDTCKELIYEIPRYREKLPHDPETQERKGEMMKVQDDLVDGLIAICNSGYVYKTLMGMKNRSKFISEFRTRPVYDESQLTEAVGGW